jgi:hypothetical protein
MFRRPKVNTKLQKENARIAKAMQAKAANGKTSAVKSAKAQTPAAPVAKPTPPKRAARKQTTPKPTPQTDEQIITAKAELLVKNAKMEQAEREKAAIDAALELAANVTADLSADKPTPSAQAPGKIELGQGRDLVDVRYSQGLGGETTYGVVGRVWQLARANPGEPIHLAVAR